MTNEHKHSPLPWETNEKGGIQLTDCLGNAKSYKIVWSSNGVDVAYIYAGMGDADIIVRACNSHYQLVEALERMMESHGMHGPCRSNNCKDCDAAYKQARAALDLARQDKEGNKT